MWPALLLLPAAVAAWLFAGPHRRLPERFEVEANRRGWLIEGGGTERKLFSLIRRDVRVSLRGVAGVSASVDRIELGQLPFAESRVSLGHVRAELRGELPMLLDALLAALPSGDSRLVPARLDLDYRHPRLGAVRFEDVRLESRGTWLVLRARKAEAAGRGFGEVVLSIERRKDMLLVAAGESPAESKLQLSCFPPREGISRWLLSILHQELRPLANAMGWNLGGDFDPAKVAGAVTLELPEAASATVEGRISLVFDRWPMAAPPEAEPLFGTAFSLLSNIVFDRDLASGRLPRLEIKMPVFSLVGSGRVGLGPTLSIEAAGQRTCRELEALLPPSDAREQVVSFLERRTMRASRDQVGGEASLGLRLDASAQVGQDSFASWSFQPACGLPPWAASR